MGEAHVLPSTVKAYTGIITTCVGIAGIFINIMSIFTVCFYTKTSTKVLYLIMVNLFISNLAFDAFSQPVTAIHIIQNWPEWGYTDNLCKWLSLTENSCTTVVVISLMLLAFDRYFVTIKKKVLPVKAISLFSVLIWGACLCLHGAFSFSSNPYTIQLGNENVSICNAFIGEPLPSGMSYYSTAALINLILLLTATLISLRTGVFIWCGRVRGSVKTKKYTKQEFKITLIITAFTWLFWLPKWIVHIVRGNNGTIASRVTILAHMIATFNSIFPGVVCMLFSKDFRRSFLDILRGGKGSTLRSSNNKPRPKPKKDELDEPLTNDLPSKRYYQEIESPPTFVKGEFKTFDKDVDLCQVSIDSTFLDDEKGPGKQNVFFEQIDSKF